MKKWLFFLLILFIIASAPVIFTSVRTPNLILQAAGLFISSVIAASAIWGEHIRASFAGPKLVMGLKNDVGGLTRVTNGPEARYYHLRVSNKRSAAIARNTRVQIISIQREIGGIWVPRQEAYGVEPQWVFSDSSPKNIAYDALCDIVSVFESGDCWISSSIRPNNIDLSIKSGQKIRLEIIAIAENAKSKILLVEISWDGQWARTDEDMKKHFKIKEV